MKNRYFFSGARMLIVALLAVGLIFSFQHSALADETEEDTADIIKYLEEVGAEEQEFFFEFMLDNFEGDDLAVNTIKDLIEQYAEGELEAEDLHETVDNIIQAQNAGVSGDDFDTVNENISDEADHGQSVAETARALIDLEEDEDVDGEAVSDAAQELAEFAASKGEVTEEEMKEAAQEKAEEAKETAEEKAAEAKDTAEEKASEADENAEQAEDEKPEDEETPEDAPDDAGPDEDTPGDDQGPPDDAGPDNGGNQKQ